MNKNKMMSRIFRQNFIRVRFIVAALGLIVTLSPIAVVGAPSSTVGHISHLAINGGGVLIITDSPLPDNCVGYPSTYLQILPSYTAMTAFVLALWARGDQLSVNVTVYTTSGTPGGFCQVVQIEPS